MLLEILTPEKKLFTGQATSVMFPGTAGVFEVLENHAPLISTLDPGKIRVKSETGEDQYFEINAGFVEVLNNVVTVMV
jgi:F-type H+-transporting ATPase subunit epsilon